MKVLTVLLIAALTVPLLFAAEPAQDSSVFPSNPKVQTDEQLVVKGGFGANSVFPSDPKIQTDAQLVVKDGFGARFSLIDDEQFFVSWIPGGSSCPPNVTKAKRNKPVYVAIFIADPMVRRTPSLVYANKASITTDVNYDFEVIKADGSFYGGAKGLAAWSGRPPAKNLVQLARSHPEIKFEVIDPPGIYTINVVIRDNVRKVTLALQRKISLEE
ncbi:MAG: hypothetical protein WCP06_07710 [Verrucomicrobiota bacterium]